MRTERKEATANETTVTLGASEPSSPLIPAFLLSPKQPSLAASPGIHRPPMSIVVIKGSYESSVSAMDNEQSVQTSWSFSSPTPGMVCAENVTEEESKCSWQRSRAESVNGSMSTAQESFASFQLKPRNHVSLMSSPSHPGRGMLGSRGRKRPAQSISIPVGSGSSVDSPLRPPRHFHSKDDATNTSSSKVESISPGSESTPKSLSGYDMDCLKMQALTLQSPVTRGTSESSKGSTGLQHGNQQSANRSRASSFSVYVPWPAESVVRDVNTSMSSNSSAILSRTPCSSTRSSPRHVPLTVLTSKNSVMMRPPLHDGGASLLFSLDQCENESEDDALGSPGIHLSTAPASNSSISSDEAERKGPSAFSSPMRPSAMMYCSPSKTAVSSPRTPLPRIMLTPRTPQSTGSRKKTELPMFPSPSDDDISTINGMRQANGIDDAMDGLLNRFAGRCEAAPFRSSTGYIPPPEGARNPGMLSHCYNDSSNSLAFSADGSKSDARAGEAHQVKHYRHDSWQSVRSTESDKKTVKPALPQGWMLPTPEDTSKRGLQKPEAAGIPPFPAKPHSMMAPSRPDYFLRAMMDANAQARAAEAEIGSLSDSCDEDDFVLTCPSRPDKSSSEACDVSRRPKKLRDSYDQTMGNYKSESCSSLTSGLASANSLFGMEFYNQEEGHSVVSGNGPTTPFSIPRRNKSQGSFGALSAKGCEDHFAPFGLPRRGQSEHSLGSLGLSLDGPSASIDGNQGRDLVTPPATMHVAFSPPPLPTWEGPDEALFQATPHSQNNESAQVETKGVQTSE